MSRSLRVKTAVDYTQPGDFEDDDDDFSSASLPPSKKSRLVANSDEDDSDKAKRKPEKRALRRPKKSSQDTALSTAAKAAKPSKDERPSLDERLFERDLKKVLALSGGQTEIMASSQESSQETMGSANLSTNDSPVVVANAATAAVKSPRQTKQKDTHDCHSEQDDETVESSESAGESDSDDSDYRKPVKRFKAPKATSAAAANRRGTKAAAARGGAKRTAREVRADVAPVLAVRPTPKRSPSPVLSKPTVRVTASHKPKWVPPAPAGKNSGLSPGTTNQSPGPILRLGLSKRAKLTPLHPGST